MYLHINSVASSLLKILCHIRKERSKINTLLKKKKSQHKQRCNQSQWRISTCYRISAEGSFFGRTREGVSKMALGQIHLEIAQPLVEDQKRGNLRDKEKIIRAPDKQKFLVLKQQTKMQPDLEISDPGINLGVRTQAHGACRWKGQMFPA